MSSWTVLAILTVGAVSTGLIPIGAALSTAAAVAAGGVGRRGLAAGRGAALAVGAGAAGR